MSRRRNAARSAATICVERARFGSARGRDDLRAFSLVEIAVVLVILGLLAAVGISRFVDLSGDAHSAQVAGTGKSFREAVGLVHAKWIARGAAASVNSVTGEGGASVGVNDSGWPENALAAGGDGTVTASECADLWPSLLSAAPTISTTSGAAGWLASVQGTTTCRYVYNATAGREFSYDTSTGAVVTTSGYSTASTASSTGGSTTSPSSTPTGSGSSGSSGSDTTTACGLVGPEPLVVLALVRLARATRRRREAA